MQTGPHRSLAWVARWSCWLGSSSRGNWEGQEPRTRREQASQVPSSPARSLAVFGSELAKTQPGWGRETTPQLCRVRDRFKSTDTGSLPTGLGASGLGECGCWNWRG